MNGENILYATVLESVSESLKSTAEKLYSRRENLERSDATYTYRAIMEARRMIDSIASYSRAAAPEQTQ